jgi:HEAT repeat protein
MSPFEKLVENKDVKGLVYNLEKHEHMDARALVATFLGDVVDGQTEPQLKAKAIKALIRAIKIDDGGHVRLHAGLSLGKIGDRSAVRPLIKALKFKHHWYGMARWGYADALGMIGDKRAVGPLITALHEPYDKDKRLYEAAIRALKKIGGGRAERALKKINPRDINLAIS